MDHSIHLVIVYFTELISSSKSILILKKCNSTLSTTVGRSLCLSFLKEQELLEGSSLDIASHWQCPLHRMFSTWVISQMEGPLSFRSL